MSYVSTDVRKKDAMSLVTEKGVYTGDTVPAGALRLKLLRSPHVHAFIRSIDVSRAKQVPGVVCVLTYEDAPGSRFTTAGQTYPEPSPYDRLILDRLLRCTGDPVAIVAAETEEAAERACRLIRVDYEARRPLLDFTQALAQRNYCTPGGKLPRVVRCGNGCPTQFSIHRGLRGGKHGAGAGAKCGGTGAHL